MFQIKNVDVPLRVYLHFPIVFLWSSHFLVGFPMMLVQQSPHLIHGKTLKTFSHKVALKSCSVSSASHILSMKCNHDWCTPGRLDETHWKWLWWLRWPSFQQSTALFRPFQLPMLVYFIVLNGRVQKSGLPQCPTVQSCSLGVSQNTQIQIAALVIFKSMASIRIYTPYLIFP